MATVAAGGACPACSGLAATAGIAPKQERTTDAPRILASLRVVRGAERQPQGLLRARQVRDDHVAATVRARPTTIGRGAAVASGRQAR